MALALTAQQPDYTRRRKVNRLIAKPSGNYATGGDPIDLSTIANPNWYPNIGFGQVPNINDLKITKAPAGYDAEIVAGAGSTLATAFKLKVFTTANTELGAGAYPAEISGDNFLIEANVSTWTQ